MISNRCARKSLVTNCNSIISKNYLRFLVDSNDAKHKISPAGEYTLILPPLEYSGRDILIGLNLNYNFIDNAMFASMDNPIFLIRKEMMDMIGNKYASHISRIGITSFQ